MKLETLAKRIAEKSDTPALEKIVLGQGTVRDLPDRCIVWRGSATGKTGHRPRIRRGYDHLPYLGIAYDRPRPVINFQNKTYHVPRLLFEKLYNKPFPFRFHQLCATERCINPMHFEPRQINLRECDPLPEEEAANVETVVFEEWSDEDVSEVIELALIENTPGNWAELMALPIMEDAPEKQVQSYLRSINKPHLLPCCD